MLRAPGFALADIVLLPGALAANIVLFRRIDATAGWLLVPLRRLGRIRRSPELRDPAPQLR